MAVHFYQRVFQLVKKKVGEKKTGVGSFTKLQVQFSFNEGTRPVGLDKLHSSGL